MSDSDKKTLFAFALAAALAMSNAFFALNLDDQLRIDTDACLYERDEKIGAIENRLDALEGRQPADQDLIDAVNELDERTSGWKKLSPPQVIIAVDELDQRVSAIEAAR